MVRLLSPEEIVKLTDPDLVGRQHEVYLDEGLFESAVAGRRKAANGLSCPRGVVPSSC